MNGYDTDCVRSMLSIKGISKSVTVENLESDLTCCRGC